MKKNLALFTSIIFLITGVLYFKPTQVLAVTCNYSIPSYSVVINGVTYDGNNTLNVNTGSTVTFSANTTAQSDFKTTVVYPGGSATYNGSSSATRTTSAINSNSSINLSVQEICTDSSTQVYTLTVSLIPITPCSVVLSNSAAGQVAWSVVVSGNIGNVYVRNSSNSVVGAGTTNTGTVSNLPPGSYSVSAATADGTNTCFGGPATVLAPVLSASAPGGTTATVTTGSNSMNIIYTNTGPAKTTAHVNGLQCSANYSGAGITNVLINPSCTTVDLPNP